MGLEESYQIRMIDAQLRWYEKRKKVVKVDWKLLIGAILIMGFFVFAGVYLKENLVNQDLGTIVLMGVPLIGGLFAGKILVYTFSMDWVLKDRKERRKERRKYK